MAVKRLIQRRLIPVIRWLKRVSLPGFQGMSLYEVASIFWNGLTDSKFTLLAAAMSYSFFFSFFPLLIIIYTLLLEVPIQDFPDHAATYFAEFSYFIPDQIENLIRTKIADPQNPLSQQMQQGSVWGLLVLIFLVLYGALRGIIAMMKAFTKDAEKEEIFKRRNIFQLYGWAFVIFCILGTLVFISISTFIAGEYFTRYLLDETIISAGLKAGGLRFFTYLITLLLLFFSISIIYYLAPATQQRWKFLSPGALVAGVLILFIFIGFGYFISNFSNLDRFYGGVVSIIVLMLWFYYISMVLLVGFELNAAIHMASFKQKKKDSLSPPAPVLAVPTEQTER